MLHSWSLGFEVSAIHMMGFLNRQFDTLHHNNNIAVAKVKAEPRWQSYEKSFRTSWISVNTSGMYCFYEKDGSEIVKQWLMDANPTSWGVHTGYVSMFKPASDLDLVEAYGGINGMQTNLNSISVDKGSYEEVSHGGQEYWRFQIKADAEYVLEDNWKMLPGMEEDKLGLVCLQNCFGYRNDETRTHIKNPGFESFGDAAVYKISIRQTKGGKVTMSGYSKGVGKEDGEDNYKFTEGTQVNFSAECEEGYKLVSWSGGPKLTVSGPEMVSAKFEKKKKKPKPPRKFRAEQKIDVRTSLDPQDKWGPAGYDLPGTAAGQLKRYVRADQALAYRVEIWNKPEAEVPTQDATIRDTLDPNLLDLSTFAFTRVGFLGWDNHLAPTQSLDLRIDAAQMNLAVEVTGSINFATGQVDWLFHTIDPLTGLTPEDISVGFLPPMNVATGYEIAWVEFSVMPKAGLGTGTVVANQAFTQFDFIGPIGPAPEAGPWVNTLDASTPASAVAALSSTTTTADFTVAWSGSDTGSGLVGYDVYASTDGGDYQLWLDDTTAVSSTFHGLGGHSYRFYSTALDGVGHEEAAPASPDATTAVHIPGRVGQLTTTTRLPLPSAPLTLVAGGVTAGDDAVAGVQFLLASSNGTTLNRVLGTDTDGSDGWSWSGLLDGITPGPAVFKARVRDAAGVLGPYISLSQPLYRTVTVTGKGTPFPDASGDLVAVSLTGGGTATLYFGAEGRSDVAAIVTSQTTIYSKLVIASRGQTSLGGLDTSGLPLGAVVAKTTDLSGLVKIGPTDNAKAAVSMTFARVHNASIDVDMPVKAFKAVEWLDEGEADLFEASRLASLVITGRRATATLPLSAGHFQADVHAGPSTQYLPALGKVAVAGTVSGSAITADGYTLKGVSIGSIKAGMISSAVLSAAGGVSAIAASDWADGSITAGWLGSLKSSANARLSRTGDVGADITLTGAAVPLGKPTLGAAKLGGNVLAGSRWDVRAGYVKSVAVAGTVRDSILRSAGDIYKLTIGASDGSDYGAGVSMDLLASARHVAQGDLAHQPTAVIRALAVKGLKVPTGQPVPRFFVDSCISSAIGKLSLRNWDGQGGLYAPAGKVVSVRHSDTVNPLASWSWPSADLSGGQDEYVHII